MRSQPSTLHKYAYTANNPVSLIDPWCMGAEEEDEILAADKLAETEKRLESLLKYQKRSKNPFYRIGTDKTEDIFDEVLAWIIHEVSSKKRKDALKGMMNTGFAHPAFPFGASIA